MANYDSSVTAFFGGDTSGLEKAVDRASTVVGSFQAALSKIGVTIGAAAVIGFFKSVVDKASEIQDMSDALGVGTDAIQSFSHAVRLAGGNVQDANLVLRTVRNSVDELAEGNDKATATFAKLGLAQKDLVGIPLEAALEKIARGFVANKDQAGAYSALVDIIGSKSAKLTGVLEELGVEGFAVLEERARAAGQLIESDTIARLDKLGDKLEETKGVLVSWGAKALDVVYKSVQGIGVMAAVVVNYFDGIKTVGVDLENTGKKAASALEGATRAVNAGAAATKEAAKLEKERQKAFEEHIKAQDKLRELLFEAMTGEQKIKVLEQDRVEILGNIQKMKAAGVDTTLAEVNLQETLKKLEAERAKKAEDHIKTMDRLAELKFDRLSIDEKINKLVQQEAEITRNIAKMKREKVDSSQAEVKLMETQNELTEQRAKLAKKVTQQENETLRVQLEQAATGEAIMNQYNLRRRPEDIEGASEAELKELIRRTQARIKAIDDVPMSLAEGVSGGYGRKFEKIPLTADLSAAQAELARRKEVQIGQTLPGGIDAARRKFDGDPLRFDEFFSRATEGVKAQNESAIELKSIRSTLQNIFKR